jgi:hypothetical protein
MRHLADHPDQQLAVKDPGRLRQAAQAAARNPQDPLDLLQLAGFLQGAERIAEGIEQVQQDQREILVQSRYAI